MKNTNWNNYIFNTIRKRAIVYLIRHYDGTSDTYDYVYANALYAINKQIAVFSRANNIHLSANPRIINKLDSIVGFKTIDLLCNKIHHGHSINFDNI